MTEQTALIDNPTTDTVTVPAHITFPIRCEICPVTGTTSCPTDMSKTVGCSAC